MTFEAPTHTRTPSVSTLHAAQGVIDKLKARLGAAVMGRDEVIELVLIALLADGHVLLEDYPGSGKTTLARALGGAIEEGISEGGIAAFRRIQFTPDLLPSDVTGSSIFEPESGRFVFRRGPLFAHVVLADEINRTSPKVQSAMLEAMAEKQVTVDNQTYPLDELFFVIATQNPLDLAGTYPLPTPQLDRFLFKIEMRHIERDAELRVLATYPRRSLDMAQEQPSLSADEIVRSRHAIREAVHMAPVLREALVDLARGLRNDERVLQGASTRALVLMLPALQARAAIQGRDYVTPEDVEVLAPYVFKHRIECAPGVEDSSGVISAAAAPVLDRLAKESMRR